MFMVDCAFNFNNQKKPNLVLRRGVFTPFNAQATLWRGGDLDTYALMLLPTTVHGRVSDIWRSYFAQWLLEI